MYKFYSLVFALMCAFGLKGQDILNMELLSNLPYPSNLSDIWGYVAPDGHEYAIVGTAGTTSIVDLADPRNPVEVASIPGANSIWRDMKSFGEYVYVTNDTGADGLLVINMKGAPNNITSEFWQPSINIDGNETVLGACHNIYIDEDGYAYLAGCNMNSGGNLIIDVFTNPGQPEFVGATDARYSHDAMTQNNLLYSSDISAGSFSVIDVSDKTDPITLSTQTTTSNFTHNAWVSTDNNFLFTTDERPNANVDAYDISDLTDIKRLDFFQPEASKGTGTIPHNTHYHNGYLVTSWYTDGVRIIDANKPDNLVEVAFYDTYPQANAGFNGVWGVTPYLPSGIVIASDINTGLYVFGVDYKRAAYLEGVVTNADNGSLIEDVSVVISGPQLNSKTTNNIGEYKTGLVEAGEVEVLFSKIGFNDLTTTANITNGELTILNVEMIPMKTYAIAGTIKSKIDNSAIENGRVLFQNENFEYEVSADAGGNFVLEDVFEGEYLIYSGAWGYENIIVSSALSLSQDESVDILLDRVYMDDFIVDQGWTVDNQAETGAWEREIPIGTTSGNLVSNPGNDVDGDIGNKAYVTGNEVGGVGDFDIDGGSVTLTSPIMDLTTYTNPSISYSLWFFNNGGSGTPNDNVVVRISNGETEVDVEILTVGDSEGIWRPTFSFLPSDLLEITATMQFSVIASDFDPGHIVEAGLDNFLVSESPVSVNDLVSNVLFEVQPNPFANYINLTLDKERTGEIKVTNVLGQLIETISLENASQVQLGNTFNKGTYFLSLESDGEQFEALRIVKQ